MHRSNIRRLISGTEPHFHFAGKHPGNNKQSSSPGGPQSGDRLFLDKALQYHYIISSNDMSHRKRYWSRFAGRDYMPRRPLKI